jgi:hypothetical protein
LFPLFCAKKSAGSPAVLQSVGAHADPLHGEDKVVAITAAVAVAVTPRLAQHTQPTGKCSNCSDGPRQEHYQNDPSNDT